MKILGTALIVLGIAAVISAGVITLQDVNRSRTFDTKIRDFITERSQVREELRGVNLEYRGYQQSIPSMPDSTKKQNSGQIMAKYRDYNKKVKILENRERELTRLVLRQQSMKAQRNERIRWWMAGVGGIGALMVALGLGVARKR